MLFFRSASFFALTAVLFWSTVATSFKIALKDLHYIQVLSIAAYTSTVIFFFALLINKKLKETFIIPAKQLFYSAISGLLNPFIYYIILLKAYSILPAYMAQPLNYTWPIVLTIMSAWLLKQKLSLISLVAFIFSLIGVFFISLSNNYIKSSVNILGVLLATSSSIIWSLFWIINVKDKRSIISKMFLNFLFGSIYLSIILLLIDLPKISYNISFFASIYIGFFEMGFTFLLWLTALNKITRTDKISILIFLSPIISMFFISIILKENITVLAVVGFLFILVGIVISKWKEIFTFERGKN